MIRPAMKNLKTIGKHLTGLEIRNSHREDTYFSVERQKNTNILTEIYININFKHIDNMYTCACGVSKKELVNKYLIALLHEVAHYKQFKKMSLRKWFNEDYNQNEQRENVAIRYARRYYKRFII